MPKKQIHIDLKHVKKALEQVHVQVRAHLDLEGVCYVKVTRSGAQACFATDVTGMVLRGEVQPGLSWKDLSRTFWEHPACEKDWDKK